MLYTTHVLQGNWLMNINIWENMLQGTKKMYFLSGYSTVCEVILFKISLLCSCTTPKIGSWLNLSLCSQCDLWSEQLFGLNGPQCAGSYSSLLRDQRLQLSKLDWSSLLSCHCPSIKASHQTLHSAIFMKSWTPYMSWRGVGLWKEIYFKIFWKA